MARLDIEDVADFRMKHALYEISLKEGKLVAFKGKTLSKFGTNTDIGSTLTMVWEQGGIEALPDTNAITTVSSSSASDTGDVVIEGHTIDGNGDFTFSIQTATLSGQTEVPLVTPLARATRLKNVGTADLVGTAYVYQDDTVTAGVPDTAAKIHLSASPDDNQSLKCATTISKDDYWVLTGFTASVNEKRSALIDFRLQVREKGGVFRTVFKTSVTNSSIQPPAFASDIIVSSNSDVRVLAIADGAASSCNATLSGYLVKV